MSESTLPATHLMGRFLVFALTVLFLSLATRAGYALWQFAAVEDASPLALFATGLRYDVSLVGTLCLIPLVGGSLLAMFDLTRALAKALVVAWLVGALIFVLGTELVTPHFLASVGARPDAASFADPIELGTRLSERLRAEPLPAVIAGLLALAILLAYVLRVDSGRFLRRRLSRPSALALAVLGGVVCLVAARSELDFLAPALGIEDVRLGGSELAGEIALNSAWKTLHPFVAPLLDR